MKKLSETLTYSPACYMAALEAKFEQIGTPAKLADYKTIVDKAAEDHNSLLRYAQESKSPECRRVAAGLAESLEVLAVELAGRYHSLREAVQVACQGRAVAS